MKFYVGVDLGGTNSKIGILDSDGKIIIKTEIKTESIKGMDYTLNKIWMTISDLLKGENIDKENVEGIGIGIPGPVKNQEVVGFFANFPWETGVNVSKKMEEISGLKTKLDNDVNVIALGEALLGAGEGYKKSITVALGTGVGGGIFIDGNLVSGSNGLGGEIGHMKLVMDGKLCGCGQKGCFETYASATGIIREATSRLMVNKTNSLYKRIEGDLNRLEAKDVFEEAKNGDAFSIDIVDYVSEYLAMGIGNLLNILNPEVIVLSGGVALAGDILLDRVKENMKKYALPLALEGLEIKFGKLGNEAGIIGASQLVRK